MPLLVAAGAVLALAIYALYTLLARPARIVPGPESAHWFYGNMRAAWARGPSDLQAALLAEYGPVVSYFGIGNRTRLVTTDAFALAHVLQNPDVYRKPGYARRMIAQLLGKGLLVAEGDAHRAQRKALNPAFGPGQLRDLTGVMLDKANELRDVLASTLGTQERAEVDALGLFSRCTLDIIGLAGFGYAFHALSPAGADDELAAAFDAISNAVRNPQLADLLALFVPGFRLLPTARSRRLGKALAIMHRIGAQLLAERKADSALEAAQGEKLADSRARDILSLLVRANTAADPRQRLSDEDVLAQIPTFLVAGHETTSSLLSWTLYELSQRPALQASLRAECLASPLPTLAHGNAPLDAAALAALDHLPLLDAVVRETARLHAPVSSVSRSAARADALPLAAPFTDRHGVRRTSVPVRKGEHVLVPIRLVNRAAAVWGADAEEWRPARWADAATAARAKVLPGVWGGTLAFLGGTHACIGFRFSVYETKIILHALLCAFDFALAVPAAEVGAQRGITSRPFVKGRGGESAMMPVVVQRAARVEE